MITLHRKKKNKSPKMSIVVTSASKINPSKTKKEPEEEPKEVSGPLIVAKKTEPREISDELKKWASTSPGFIEVFTSTTEGPVILEEYQAAHMLNQSNFRWVDKSR